MSDVMLFGVLKMPYEMAMSSELSRLQFYQRVQQLVARVEAQPAKGLFIDLIAQHEGLAKELAQDEQPEQEPMAWMHEWEDGGRVLSLYPRDARLNDQPKSVRPLVYGDTAPPQRPWVGLTDEEVNWFGWHGTSIRTIEAELKEKNT